MGRVVLPFFDAPVPYTSCEMGATLELRCDAIGMTSPQTRASAQTLP